MIITKENERLYLSSWSYNCAQILSELAKIVTNNGGKVKPTKTAIISNRSISEAIHESEKRLERLENAVAEGRGTEKTKIAIDTITAKLGELKSINNEPIQVTHLTYINFALDGVYYFYSADDNPFFPFHFCKTPIKDGKRSADARAVEDKKEWLFNCFFSFGCSQSDIKEAANLIFNILVKSKNSPIIRDSRRQRVQNTYNSDYHYETIYSPERFSKVDF